MNKWVLFSNAIIHSKLCWRLWWMRCTCKLYFIFYFLFLPLLSFLFSFSQMFDKLLWCFTPVFTLLACLTSRYSAFFRFQVSRSFSLPVSHVFEIWMNTGFGLLSLLGLEMFAWAGPASWFQALHTSIWVWIHTHICVTVTFLEPRIS